MVSTKRIWLAKPFLVAYVIAVGFTLGLLIKRAPPKPEAVPVLAVAQHHGDNPAEREVREAPIWLQLFQPSQPTARLMLRLGLPLLSVADGSAQEFESRNLVTYWTGKAGHKPQTLFQSVLPFLVTPQVTDSRPPAPSGQAEQGGHAPNPPVQPPVGQEPPQQLPRPEVRPKDTPAGVLNGGLPLVGIYHTHDWETYISEFPGLKVTTQQDLNRIASYDHSKRTILGLGDLLAMLLREQGITTVFAPFKHQDLGYAYAYKASRATARRILREAPSTRILLDLHRDGVVGVDTTAMVGGKKAAQIRCIIGTVEQPNWKQNRAFCDTLIGRLERMYPGITLPTREQPDTYNQDLLPGAILLEIGSAMNRYEEAEQSVRYLAKALAALIRDGEYPK